jgi:hypothetical protein
MGILIEETIIAGTFYRFPVYRMSIVDEALNWKIVYFILVE